MGYEKLTGSLDYSDHELEVLRVAKKGVVSKLQTLDYRRASFGLLRNLLGRVPWDEAKER